MGIALGTVMLGESSCKSSRHGDNIVLGLIGCGSRGMDILLQTSRESNDVQIKYVCDVNDQRSGIAAAKINEKMGYAPKQVRDMNLVFADKEVNAVIIATPDHWHALATILACQAGKDVYLEANPTHCLWEGLKIQQASVRYKKIVQIGFQNRSAAFASTAREYIGSGKLGQIVHVKTYNLTGGSKWLAQANRPVSAGLDWSKWLGPAVNKEFSPGIYEVSEQGGWSNYWNFGGGILANETSHLLDLARMVLGDPGHPASVYCSGGNWCWNSECEVPENQSVTYNYGKFAMTCETGNAMNYMKNGLPSVVGGQQPSSDWMRASARIEIYGTEGLMYLGLNEMGWQVVGKEGELIAGEAGINTDKAHFDNFISCIRDGKKPASDVEQGHLSAALVHLGNIAYRVGNKHLIFNSDQELFTNNEQANGLLKTNYREGFVIPGKV